MPEAPVTDRSCSYPAINILTPLASLILKSLMCITQSHLLQLPRVALHFLAVMTVFAVVVAMVEFVV